MAPAVSPLYLINMKGWRLLLLPAIAAAAIGASPATATESVPLYTSEDLEKLFGPAPAAPSDPVDKSGPEDWRFVEQFLDRQYSRIEADRSFDLSRRTLDIAENRVAPAAPYRYSPVAWSLGYPASTWWQGVWSSYSGAEDEKCRPGGRHFKIDSGHRGNGGSRGPRHFRR